MLEVRALEVQSLDGPDGVALVDRPEPLDDGTQVIVDVVSAGVAFPDLLQSKGLYQIRPDLPFVPGLELSGIVRSAPESASVKAGDRVCAWGGGALAEVAACPADTVYSLPEELTFDEGAGLVLNYQTAVFCMGIRGGLTEGESVLVLGASGGVGTSGIQVARGLGASTIIGLVSTEEKAAMATAAGADEVVLISDRWKDDVLALTDGRGVDMTYDPVGGERFLDGVRCLARYGRLVVVGFAAGTIPEIRVNRLLLKNVSIVGAAWGEAAFGHPELTSDIHNRLIPMIKAGIVKPPVGAIFSLDDAVEAYRMLDERRAVGKVVVKIRDI